MTKETTKVGKAFCSQIIMPSYMSTTWFQQSYDDVSDNLSVLNRQFVTLPVGMHFPHLVTKLHVSLILDMQDLFFTVSRGTKFSEESLRTFLFAI